MAKLNSGTRIYGTANVDTSIGIGSSGVINATGFYTTGTSNAVSYTIGSNYIANTTGVYTNGTINSTSYTIGSNFIANTTGVYTTGTINALSYSVGNTFVANTTQLYFNANVVIAANGDVVFNSNSGIYANGSLGSNGQVLSSNGTTVYWANVTSSGSGGFSNGQSISVANLAITGSLTANGSVGTSGQALVSTGTGVQWGALSPGYNYSSQFNGSSYFTVPYTTAKFDWWTGDYTIECWVYPTTFTNWLNVIGNSAPASTLNYWALGLNSSGQANFYYFNGAGVNVTGTVTASLNAWNHLAMVKTSSGITVFINGIASSTTAISGTPQSSTSTPIGIGALNNNGITGYVSNIRVVKGTALYSGNFTVPTSPLSAITNTTLLTCTAITPSDISSYNSVVTNSGVTGSATLSPFTSTTVSIPTSSLTAVNQQFVGDGSTTTFSVAGGYTPNAIAVYYNGLKLRNGSDVTVTNGSTIIFPIAPQNGSLIDVVASVPTTYSSITPVSYSVGFNGTSQYLSSTGPYTIGTGDFTFEFWLNYTGGNGYVCFFCTTSGSPQVYYGLQTGTLYPFVWNGTSAQLVSSTNITLNSWQHHAVVRKNGVLTIFLNGISIASTTYSSSIADGPIVIGNNGASAQYTTGYMSNFRFVSGVAVYTGAFTPPQTPLAAVQSAVAPSISAITGSQTKLLTCNAPTIVDGSTNAFTITNNGSAPVSTAVYPTFTNVTINNTTTTAATYSVQALLIGGGGAGGAGEAAPGGDGGGGGGAGGVIQNNINLSVGTVYSVVIGAGGSSGGAGAVGGTGGNSTFAGLIAYGGGGGGTGDGGTATYGGSGGGAGNNYSTNNYGGGCTYLQGYPGGDAAFNNTTQRGGSGGGGAGGYGGYRGSNSGANGGSGIGIGITGSTVFYAGGGAGGGSSTSGGGVGGNGFGVNQGGGGNGASSGVAATTGTTNTGGGGGGGCGHNTGATYSNGSAGGSGVVILSIPTANYTGTKTGSPTVTTSGSYTILTFTASGSYTA